MICSDAPLLVEILRSNRREALHRVHAVACDSSGELLGYFGDPGLMTYFRSSAKPFQLLTVLSLRPELINECSDEEIAVMASSHSGEPGHLESVKGLLDRYALDHGMIKCGWHYPYWPDAIWNYGRDGIKIGDMHNNCTGKHTAMLLACQSMGWDFGTYLEDTHPLQVQNTSRMARYSGQKVEDMVWGVDGCSVPTWWMSLRQCAIAYANFSSPEFNSAEENVAINRIFDAYHKAAWHTAGTKRIGTSFNLESDGMWLGKIGGEGIYGVSFRGRGIGIVIKVEEGNGRAIPPALLHFMILLDLITENQLDRLSWWVEVPIPNAAGKPTGLARLVE